MNRKTVNSGKMIEHVIVTLARRRHVPLSEIARSAGFRRISMFRRFARTGNLDTDQLDRIAAMLGTSIFGIARMGLTR